MRTAAAAEDGNGGLIEQDGLCLIYHEFYKSPVAGPLGSVAHIMAAT